MAAIQKWNFLTCIKCFGKKDGVNEIKKQYEKVLMVLPISISMSVHEIQCGALVHFCMVNSGYKKSGHDSIFDLGGFGTGPFKPYNTSMVDVINPVNTQGARLKSKYLLNELLKRHQDRGFQAARAEIRLPNFVQPIYFRHPHDVEKHQEQQQHLYCFTIRNMGDFLGPHKAAMAPPTRLDLLAVLCNLFISSTSRWMQKSRSRKKCLSIR